MEEKVIYNEFGETVVRENSFWVNGKNITMRIVIMSLLLFVTAVEKHYLMVKPI